MNKKILGNLDSILISSVSNLIYLTKDFGFSENEREAFILITKNNKYFITDMRYSNAVLNSNLDFKLIYDGVYKFLDITIDQIIKKEKIKTLGIEENNLFVSEYKILKGKAKLKSIDLTKLKIVKREEEIKRIKKACQITDEAFSFIIKQLKTGVSEKEVSIILENFIKNKNAEISFRPIIAFGKNSATPHHLSDQTKLKKNQIVLLDFGVKYNSYCSDMTRTVFFGKADKKFIKTYQTVLEAQSKAVDFINEKSASKNGLKANEIDKTARDHIINMGFPSIPHSLGHGIGIEVHEAPNISPSSKQKIINGMIFSIEPGIYLENWGGIRIEDLVLIKNNKAQLIYSSTREIIEV